MDDRTTSRRITAAALRARRGDAAAATAFVRATQADVWRLCAHLGSPAQADDLTQETYARAFASLHRFLGRSAARTWLLAIARTCAPTPCARPSATAARAAGRARTGAPTRPARWPCARWSPGLDPERREAFVLTQVVGLSYAEAADVCSCPVGTIRSRVARARADLVDGLGGGAQSRTRPAEPAPPAGWPG